MKKIRRNKKSQKILKFVVLSFHSNWQHLMINMTKNSFWYFWYNRTVSINKSSAKWTSEIPRARFSSSSDDWKSRKHIFTAWINARNKKLKMIISRSLDTRHGRFVSSSTTSGGGEFQWMKLNNRTLGVSQIFRIFLFMMNSSSPFVCISFRVNLWWFSDDSHQNSHSFLFIFVCYSIRCEYTHEIRRLLL